MFHAGPCDSSSCTGQLPPRAGARAELYVGGATQPNGTRRPVIVIQPIRTTIGLLPVKAAEPIVPPVPAGTVIQAYTQAAIDHIGERYSVRVPFPFGGILLLVARRRG